MQTTLTSVEKSYITATCKSQHNDTYDVALTVLLDIAENKTCIHWNSPNQHYKQHYQQKH